MKTIMSILVLSGVAFAGNYTATGPSPRASGGGSTCQTILDNNSFDCHVVSSFSSDFNDCFQFFSPGSQSSKFDLVVMGLSSDHLGCECTPSGSPTNPKFDTSKNFICTIDSSGETFAFQGKAKADKIKKGSVGTSVGDSFVFDCTLRATPCGASPSGAFLDALTF